MIYVDPIQTCFPSRKWPYRQACHLVTDSYSLDELHNLAARIGLKRSWFQQHPLMPHYDLTPAMRQRAINAGAMAISFNRLVGMVQERKERQLETAKETIWQE